ncbi:MAG TPA: SDR family NAD(P)-dependent oxidoreductase [Solimonas sp.]
MARKAASDHTRSVTPSCFIVGAGPGIGQSCARAFADEGHDVALIARRPQRLQEAARELRQASGRRIETYAADAASETSLLGALEAASADLGAPSVLIYNAASAQLGKPTTIPVERLIEDFRVNVAGALVAARTVAPGMVARGQGTILFTGGGSAYEPAADYAALSLGKAALRSLTYTLAQELGRSGVHVGMVTVYGFVQAGTHFDPDLIAQSYLKLHRQPKGHFDIEAVYR